jgi:hypothetical protein
MPAHPPSLSQGRGIDCQDVARESRNAVGARVRDLASGASAKVLHLGKDAQQLVLVFGRDARVIVRIDCFTDCRWLAGSSRSCRFRSGCGIVPSLRPGSGISRGIVIRHYLVPMRNRYDLPRMSGLLPQKSTRGLMSR